MGETERILKMCNDRSASRSEEKKKHGNKEKERKEDRDQILSELRLEKEKK